jgi:hypothetical protein
MSKITAITLVALFVIMSALAQERAASTTRTLPEDIVQESIQFFRFSTNSFAVRWTYTEAGAKKALASWEADPKHPAISVEWKTGWLKHRTDKRFFTNETTATEFMQRIKSK